MYRNSEAESGASAGLALGFDCTAVRFGCVFDNGQTETGTPGATGPIRLIESLKYARQIGGIDPLTGIANLYGDDAVLRSSRNLDRPTVRRELDGVVD